MRFPAETRKIVFKACMDIVMQKIRDSREYLDSISESVNHETKSTAGDKHETGRAMAQIEQEKAARQLSEAMKMKSELEKLELLPPNEKIGNGSVVITNKGNFFISVPAGQIKALDTSFYAISSQSPVGLKLLGMKVSGRLDFNGQSYIIENIF